ncbi:hypothetical protein ASC94_24130 [Massilia sp. Root418]|jgi:hypothetical protein|uniref:hypothetical protein n=1 Tax=Massilia sp. Root418 TaxID=1736532 RepID=UPI0006F5AC87|nr:hypothetical protein [Massilia sp. Root418]KQW88508.1 hypothetical protein ASC94_24130 [Massilia sp. Root418]
MDAYEPRRRKFEQQTHSGTSSAGSMGAGGTGGSSQTGQPGIRDAAVPGNSQSAGRTDDLLSGGCTDDQRAEGFQRDCNADALRQGLEKPTPPRSGGNRQ